MPHLVYGFAHAPLYRNQAYTVFRSSMKGPSEWLTSHKDLWMLVLPVAETTKLLEAPAESSWKDHAAEIQEVVASGPLGCKLFGFALKLILGELVEEVITNKVNAMLKHDIISNDVFMTHFRQAKADVSNISGIGGLPERRSIMLRYRGWPLEVRVKCLADEVSFRFAVALRALAVEHGDLLPIMCEDTPPR